jgi:hypothetical protein
MTRRLTRFLIIPLSFCASCGRNKLDRANHSIAHGGYLCVHSVGVACDAQ